MQKRKKEKEIANALIKRNREMFEAFILFSNAVKANLNEATESKMDFFFGNHLLFLLRFFK